MIVAPTHTGILPSIVVGNALTVVVAVTVHVVAVFVYVITGLVPPVRPVNAPVDELTDPWAVLLLDHVPAPAASDKLIVPPTHTGILPSIAVGNALTVTAGDVTDTVLVQPAPGYVADRLYTPLDNVVVGLSTAVIAVPEVL